MSAKLCGHLSVAVVQVCALGDTFESDDYATLFLKKVVTSGWTPAPPLNQSRANESEHKTVS